MTDTTTTSGKKSRSKRSVTAKVRVGTWTPSSDGQTHLQFFADYADDRNKEWAKYTPSLSLNMVVLDSVAEHFKAGQAFTLTFEPGDD